MDVVSRAHADRHERAIQRRQRQDVGDDSGRRAGVVVVGDLHVLGPNADERVGRRPREGHAGGVEHADGRAAGVEIQEAGHEEVHGLVVDVLGRTDLHDPPLVHDRHQVGQDQRLVVIVGDVDRGDVELAEQALEVHTVLLAQRLVEVGERLVDQEDGRIARDAAAERHALLLAA